MRRFGCALSLLGLVACSRTTPVASLAPHLARADSLQLRSGQRLRVERIVAQDADSVVIATDLGTRRIALDEVTAVERRDRWRGFRQGAGAGLLVGGLAGLAATVHRHATCEDPLDGGNDSCEGEVILVGVLGLAGMAVSGLIGGGIGAALGHTDVHRRRIPINVAPTRDGVSALWTIEF